MKSRRGYILLTVLLLLMLAAVVMTGLCRLAIQKSLQASASSDELQRRWGTISCRDTLLPSAENILELNESPGAAAAPPAHLHAQFTLGGEEFDVDLSDEQARVNVNALYAIQGKARAEQSIQSLVKSVGSNLKPRLRLSAAGDIQIKSTLPGQTKTAGGADDADAVDRFPIAFGSWSEVFAEAQPSDLSPASAGAVTNVLTLWGNGSLNLRRASAAAIAQMCSPVLSQQQIGQLMLARNRLGDAANVDDLLSAAHIGSTESVALSGRITMISAAHSLWVRSRDHSATCDSMFVLDGSNSDDIRSFSFQW